jgi:hypothetical protein
MRRETPDEPPERSPEAVSMDSPEAETP